MTTNSHVSQSQTEATYGQAESVLVMMPAHHIGLLRYVKPSPSKPCRSLASMRPFFVITKLAPGVIVSAVSF